MKCYFCQQECAEQRRYTHSNDHIGWCHLCQLTNIFSVETCWNELQGYRYACFFYRPKNRDYLIKLYLTHQQTAIKAAPDFQLYLPNFPINPKNIKDKFNLYLTFS